MILTSSHFDHSGPIPKRFSGEGSDISPSLEWSGIPAGTRSFALLCEDPDAPMKPGKDHPFVHWVLYNIPANVTFLPEGIPQESQVVLPVFVDQGINSFGKIGYGGPLPPPGHGVHHYHFTVYALDEPLGIPPRMKKAELLHFIKPHIIASAHLVGTYERPSVEQYARKPGQVNAEAPLSRGL